MVLIVCWEIIKERYKADRSKGSEKKKRRSAIEAMRNAKEGNWLTNMVTLYVLSRSVKMNADQT